MLSNGYCTLLLSPRSLWVSINAGGIHDQDTNRTSYRPGDQGDQWHFGAGAVRHRSRGRASAGGAHLRREPEHHPTCGQWRRKTVNSCPDRTPIDPGRIHGGGPYGWSTPRLGARILNSASRGGLGESALRAQAYHDWVGSGGQWPVDDASNDEAYSALLARRASVILKTNGEYAIRFYGKALRMTYHPDACDKAETIAALLSVTARTRARYALCSRALAPVAALSRFAVNDQDLPVPCIVVTFPWWQPNGTLLLTSISERAVA